MPTFIQETPQRDTTGYSNNYSNINNPLTIPGVEIQRLEVNQASRAYVHIEDTAFDFDHDTFMVNLQPGRDYRVVITPDNPQALAYNKISTIYDPAASFPHDRATILNTTDGYVNGSLYTDIFGVNRPDDYVIAMSFSLSGLDGVPYRGPEPYELTVIDLTSGGPADTVIEPSVPREEVERMALLYQAALDREPDIAGLNYFVSDLSAGQSLNDIANSFYDSEEFRSQFAQFDDESYINQLYENVLNRPADQQGYDYWLNELNVTGLSQADILVSFAESSENRENAEAWLSGLAYDQNSDSWIL